MKSSHLRRLRIDYRDAINASFLLSLALLLTTGFGRNAEAFEDFTDQSLYGRYASAVTGHGGQAPGAGIGIIHFQGNGTLLATTIENLPGPVFAQRLLLPFTLDGSYSVHADGTGTASFINRAPDGSVLEIDMIFVITRARTLANGRKLATEVSITLNDLGLNTGNVVTVSAWRIPTQGEFSNGSLDGSYALTEIGQGGQAPSGGIRVFTFDGSGNFFASVVRNVKGATYGERRLSETSLNGTYNVDADGTGALSSSDGSEAIFVITKAEDNEGRRISREFFLVENALTENDGNLITGVGKRR